MGGKTVINEEIISIKNVSKRYKTSHVLKDLSFSVSKGSVVGLLGKNGCGKTTLIKCALGLLRPNTGNITVFGEDVWDLSAQAKGRLGYVPQTSSFYPWLKVHEIIDYTASFYPTWNKLLVNRLISDWDLESILNQGATVISQGLAQRLSIILALGHEPDLLVLDEPVASLDPGARRTFLKTILDIVADRGCTVLFSTHITSDLERVANRVAMLDQGKIKLDMELDELKDKVKRLKISFSTQAPQTFDVPGILRSKQTGDQEVILYVKDFSSDVKNLIENKYNGQVEVGDLNLEEIFVELMR